METAVVGLRVLLALACVLGLIWFAGRKLSGTAGVRRQRSVPLSVIGRQSLGKGAGIALVEVAGRVLLLGIGEQGVRVLTEIETPVADVVSTDVTVDGTAVPVVATTELREELDLAALTGPERLANLAGLAGLAASASARGAGALNGSILSPGTWRRAVDVVQQRTVRR